MKTCLAAFALACLLSSTAQAASCADDLKKVDTALQSTDIPAEQKAQAEDMRNQAAGLCAAGNEAESLDVLSEAKAMLGVE